MAVMPSEEDRLTVQMEVLKEISVLDKGVDHVFLVQLDI